jgi:hypothetical protein
MIKVTPIFNRVCIVDKLKKNRPSCEERFSISLSFPARDSLFHLLDRLLDIADAPKHIVPEGTACTCRQPCDDHAADLPDRLESDSATWPREHEPRMSKVLICSAKAMAMPITAESVRRMVMRCFWLAAYFSRRVEV